ncbi:hypothetical protein FIBSPDRAFT_1019369 [Athelia psychrophila]|uniref:Uncharacterized protein n=1 Tax=Athelia psychrophila TaxID=1759441 RepID=A0A166KGS8_9AGAM|nr:hypothetical protein FIBSPDRAFT_1019369 [Fibularhizoctonia sp. CBS 109695]
MSAASECPAANSIQVEGRAGRAGTRAIVVNDEDAPVVYVGADAEGEGDSATIRRAGRTPRDNKSTAYNTIGAISARGMTTYGRCQWDLFSASGPVPIAFSTELPPPVPLAVARSPLVREVPEEKKENPGSRSLGAGQRQEYNKSRSLSGMQSPALTKYVLSSASVFSAEHLCGSSFTNGVPYHVFDDASPTPRDYVGFPEPLPNYFNGPS